MAAKYIPPALRAQEQKEEQKQEEKQKEEKADPLAWLREAQRGFVAKTAEQIRQECLSMNYEQLRKRAGPPPLIDSDDYGGVHAQGGEDIGGGVCVRFDGDMRFFKQGRCAPPAPLGFTGRDEGYVNAAEAMDGNFSSEQRSGSALKREAYAAWYTQWGSRLAYLWGAEHPSGPMRKLPPPIRRVREEEKAPTRGALAAAAATVMAEKSGW